MALAILLLSSLATVAAFPAGPDGPSPALTASGTSSNAQVATAPLSSAQAVPGPFWGINAAAAQRFNNSDATAVASTPVNYIRFPAGNLAEEYNYTTSVLTAPSGVQKTATTSVAEFVSACELIGCRAILELPAEINSPATAADYANYVVHALGFQPAYWEIGNDPSGWTHYSVPWSQWATTGGGNTTPAPFATLVGNYISAVRSVDPSGQFLALGAGMGGKNYDKAWVEELAKVDGQRLAGVSVHSYIEGGPSNPSDAELFSNLGGYYSLPAQIAADRAYLAAGCPNCSQLSVFVTEINAAEVSPYLNLLPTFAGTLYLAAELVQGLTLQVTNLDWFAYDSSYQGSWSTRPLSWQGQYYLFSDLGSRLGSETVPTNVSGPSTFFAVTTASASGLANLFVNVNTTTPVTASLSGLTFAPSTPIEQYLWTNSTPQPVATAVSATGSVTLPPMSILLETGPVPGDAASYPVEFTASGLPAGGSWSVAFAGAHNSSSSASIGFTALNGSYSYSISPPTGERATPASGTVSVNGGPASVAIGLTPRTSPVYLLTFRESGLASGQSWGVTVNGTPATGTTTELSFTLPNGSFAYSVPAVLGYTASPSSGTVQIAGAAVNVSVVFTIVPAAYSVTFGESGLASGANWSVTLGGSRNSSSSASIGFSRTDGTYAFSIAPLAGYRAVPASGTVVVSGSGVSVPISFAPPSQAVFDLSFTERGLPSGRSWAVTVNGTAATNTSPTISFALPNGTYPFTVAAVAGYAAAPASGSVGVDGVSRNVTVVFAATPASYPVMIVETGLAYGTVWSGSVNRTSQRADAPASLTFPLPNGTYDFLVSPPPSYSADPLRGSFAVDGAAVTVPVSFSANVSAIHTRIRTLEGQVQATNGSGVGDVGLSLIFNGNTPASQWLNLTTGASGGFNISGLNLSGSLTAVLVDSHRYLVTLSRALWVGADALAVTVLLEPNLVPVPSGKVGPNPWSLLAQPALLCLAMVGSALTALAVRVERRRRRKLRYRQYFENPPP